MAPDGNGSGQASRQNSEGESNHDRKQNKEKQIGQPTYPEASFAGDGAPGGPENHGTENPGDLQPEIFESSFLLCPADRRFPHGRMFYNSLPADQRGYCAGFGTGSSGSFGVWGADCF